MRLGIICGRFQIPNLHEAHEALINYVFANNDRVLIFIGVGTPYSFNNPLPYSYRKRKVSDFVKNKGVPYEIQPLADTKYDDVWDKTLDDLIEDHITNTQYFGCTPDEVDICLYGARDSFLNTYKGQFKTEAVNTLIRQDLSATKIREGYHLYVNEESSDWAKGVIHVTGKQYPTSYQCVDIACFSPDGELLLGKRDSQKGWRLPGGFVDPRDGDLESSARRELYEETCISSFEMEYLGSYRIEDYRYKKEPHAIMTVLFKCNTATRSCMPRDDLDELDWIKLQDIDLDNIESEHHILINRLLQKYAHK